MNFCSDCILLPKGYWDGEKHPFARPSLGPTPSVEDVDEATEKAGALQVSQARHGLAASPTTGHDSGSCSFGRCRNLKVLLLWSKVEFSDWNVKAVAGPFAEPPLNLRDSAMWCRHRVVPSWSTFPCN